MADGSVTIEVTLTEEQIEKGLKSINADLKSLEKSSTFLSNKMANGFKNFGDKVSKAGTALTVGLTTPLTALAVAGVKYNAQMEDFEANLTTLLGNADDAKDMLADLKEMANTTPFETTDLLEATQMMLGFGLETDKTRGYLETLGDISMGNSEKLMSLTRAFSQIGAAGKATMEDINQMIDAGFNPLQIMSEKTGKSMAELRDEVSEGEISFEDIAEAMEDATKEGGRYYKSMEKASKTMNGKFSTAMDALNTALGEMTESLLPLATKAVEKITDWANAFAELDDESKQTILTIAGIAVAVGPVLTVIGKLSSGIGTTVKAFGTLKTAMDVARGVTTSTSTAVNGLAKVFSAITSPIGLAVTGITTSISLISIAVQNMTKDTKEAFTNMGSSASEFITGIDTAESHLDEFNSTLFASSEEQQKLKEDMQEVQDGITSICKTASDERRNYTQEEITQLDEYFQKLRELKDREIEIQQNISSAIAQQAEQNAQSFQGSLEEYKIQSQEWINTAQQQAETEIALINERTTQEIALLQQRYGDKATLENEEYAREYNNAITQKDKLIAQANEQVAKVNSAFSEGYLERSKQEDGWYKTLKEYSDKQTTLQENHNKKIQQIKDGELWYVTNKNQAIQSENDTFAFHQQDTWNQMYKNMDKSQQEQLGAWLAMVAQTELYGGEIDEETEKMVDNILASYDSMPDDTKEAMKNAMEPMLTEMENKEPSLFAKASNIADGILSRLKKSFDIHSPSKKTKKIFEYVMEGAEVGLDKKEKSLYKDIDRITKGVLRKFRNKDLYSKMQSAVDIESQKLSANLTNNQIIRTQIEDNRQATLQSIDDNKEIVVNNTTKLDSKVIARETNKVNARRQLQYSY
mgnify:CR=1 FL=1